LQGLGNEFVFTAGEQAFYAEKGFQNEPTRCKSCRDARKASRGTPGEPREMFETVCAECGKPTRFRLCPRATDRIYCSECFAARRQ
jgi:CxxC-x17-CxxC domain-containing protein